MNRQSIALFVTLAGLTAVGLTAAEAAPVLQPQGAVVTLTGEAERVLPNDEALVTFTVERQAPTVDGVTKEVVEAGNAGLAKLQTFDKQKVVVETADFSTWPVYTKAREGEVAVIGAWSARQTIRVTVKDVDLVTDVMKACAETMQYDGITFRVSDAAKKKVETELLEAALNDAKRRAAIVAGNFDLSDEHCQVVSISLGNMPSAPVRYYAAPRMANDMALKSAAAVPAVSAGESTLEMRVGMEVRIQPK